MARPNWRSGFERKLRERLDAEKVKYGYETESFEITLDVPGYCTKCGAKDVARKSRYTPDFFFASRVVEAKGKFTSRDRKRFLALVSSYPDRRFALLFQRDNWVTKKRKQRYSDWCERNGIEYAISWFKEEWLV